MHSAFNLLVFPNSMFTLLLLFYWKGYVLSGEIAHRNNHYYYYYVHELAMSLIFYQLLLTKYTSIWIKNVKF